MIHSIRNVPLEFSLTPQEPYRDIFNEIEVDVVFEGQNEKKWKVPAFWAGGNVFRVRFAAPEPGSYTWQSICTNMKDKGLHGQTGELELVDSSDIPELYRLGRLRVANTKRTLEHQDGTPFFWLGDTWWFGLVRRFRWPDDFRQLAADRVAKGFNLIQIVAGPLPDIDLIDNPWDMQQANEGGLPWERDWSRINPAYYDMADLRIAYLVECGLMPCIVSMWGFFLPVMGVAKVKQHWRNLVARYGAYPVVWCLAGEFQHVPYSVVYRGDREEREKYRKIQTEGWTELARYLREIDPYHNLITAHPATKEGGGRAVMADLNVLDVDMVQTGHLTSHQALCSRFETIRKAIETEPRIPVVEGEPCYEGIKGVGYEDIQRFFFWTNMTSGISDKASPLRSEWSHIRSAGCLGGSAIHVML